MGFFDRFRRSRKTPYSALSDEEKMSRYVYLLNSMPAAVIEKAHADAFKDVPLERRREMFDQLRPFMSEAEQRESAEPELLARVVRRAEERRAARADGSTQTTQRSNTATAIDPAVAPDPRDVMLQAGIMPLVAYNFLISAAVFTYYSEGAGYFATSGEPQWVSDLGTSGAGAGYDGGGYGGGGYDGGGFGGGFDGGGGFG